MLKQSLHHTFQRYRTLQTDRIFALPVLILMPHSSCNCKCLMCDIWKDNKNLKQLSEADVEALLTSLRKFGTKQVVMSGGEALLHSKFFQLCDILQKNSIKITLLSTGLSLQKNAEQILKYIDEIIVSLDGTEPVHDQIRAVPNAYKKLKEGVQYLKFLKPHYRITARTVIHKLNFKHWASIVDSAKEIGLDQISFLPADVSSEAFNRQTAWNEPRQLEILPGKEELEEFKKTIENLVLHYTSDFESGFIAESPEKIQKIYAHYAASHSLSSFPQKKCNAPWVSAVIEADGAVKPCFFHKTLGNIKEDSFDSILNSEKAIHFRKNLNVATDHTCLKCVCYLNLPPYASLQ